MLNDSLRRAYPDVIIVCRYCPDVGAWQDVPGGRFGARRPCVNDPQAFPRACEQLTVLADSEGVDVAFDGWEAIELILLGVLPV
jgi:hypothetical protein